MTTPARTKPAGDLEPGWSSGEPNGYGPCYKRHVPGHGLLQVTARPGGYSWWLSTRYRHPLAYREGPALARPRDAMRDAERHVARLPERMFQSLTPGETQELYRRLTRAHDWGDPGRGITGGDQALRAIREELYIEMQIQATDPSYIGPDPHKFIWAVKDGSYGAAWQAMDASPNRQSWLSMTPHGKPQRLAAAAARGAFIASELPAGPGFPGLQVPALPPAPGRRTAGTGTSPAAQARPRRSQ